MDRRSALWPSSTPPPSRRPGLSLRNASKVAWCDVGLTSEALTKLAEQRSTTLRDLSTWSKDTLAGVRVRPRRSRRRSGPRLVRPRLRRHHADEPFAEGVRHARDHHPNTATSLRPVSSTRLPTRSVGHDAPPSSTIRQHGPLASHALESLPTWAWATHGPAAPPGLSAPPGGVRYVADHGHIDVPSPKSRSRARCGRSGPPRTTSTTPGGRLRGAARLAVGRGGGQEAATSRGQKRDTQEPSPQWRERYDGSSLSPSRPVDSNHVNLTETEVGERMAHWASHSAAARRR